MMTKQNKEDAMVDRQKALVALDGNDSLDMLFEETRFNQMQRAANMFAESELVPAHFRNKPANVMVALQMAHRIKADPLMLMQNIYMVGGKPGMEAKLVISLCNSRGPFRGPIQWDLSGDGMSRKAIAYAYLVANGDRCEAECTMKIAKDYGWLDKPGSHWKKAPDLMLQYRSASFLVNLYCPEVKMGLPSADELKDIGAPALQVAATVSDIDKAVAEAIKSKTTPAAEPKKTDPQKPKAEPKKKPDPTPTKEPEKAVEATAAARVSLSKDVPDDVVNHFDSLDPQTVGSLWRLARTAGTMTQEQFVAFLGNLGAESMKTKLDFQIKKAAENQ